MLISIQRKLRKSDTFSEDCRFVPGEVNCEKLCDFKPVSGKEVYNLKKQSKSTCDSDVWPTPLLKCVIDVLLPQITRLLNLSLSEGIFLDRCKRAIVKPLIRKTNLDTVFSKLSANK